MIRASASRGPGCRDSRKGLDRSRRVIGPPSTIPRSYCSDFGTDRAVGNGCSVFSLGSTTFYLTIVRSVAVVAVHLVILAVILLTSPVWILLPFRRQTQVDIAMKLLKLLRRWSRDSILRGQ
jgi:hypothetical protein